MTVPPPREFVCPLTMEVMNCPTLCKSTGTHYEHSSIMSWLYSGTPTCPLTRKPLSSSDLVRDYALERKIKEWVKENDYVPDSGSDDEEEQDDEPYVPSITRSVSAGSLLGYEAPSEKLGDIRNRVLERREEKIRRHSCGQLML